MSSKKPPHVFVNKVFLWECALCERILQKTGLAENGDPQHAISRFFDDHRHADGPPLAHPDDVIRAELPDWRRP